MEDHRISKDDISNNNNNVNPRQLQLFVKLVNGQTLSLQFSSPQVQVGSVKRRIQEITKIPINFQRLIRGHQLKDDSVIFHPNATLNLSFSLLGGKGGFGSLLRGAATKAGQKKTSNFEACRDMSGRRLRHVNAEKRLEEWKAEEEERKLEKMAEDFIKKKAKNGKKGVGDGEAEKYVAKYREQSARCVAVVEESVKAACLGKRKAVPGGADPKRLKIWMGKRKLNESDSDNSSDDEDSEDDEEDEKSVVLNNGNNSDSSKGTEGSSVLVSRRRRDGEFSGGVSSESGSEEEKDIVPLQSSKSGGEDVLDVENDKVEVEAIQPEMLENNGTKTEDQKEIVSQGADVPVQENEGVGNKLIDRVDGCSDVKSEFHGVTVVSNTNVAIPEKPLNFDDFNSPQEMEVLGLERLKSELQARGLKCGGTLQERAARLFLLKSIPLDKLPKKLLAKK